MRQAIIRIMRVLLITPPDGFTSKAPMPPLGLLAVAAAVRQAGHQPLVRDYAGWRRGRRAFLRDLQTVRPRALGISVLTEWRFAAAAAAKAAKQVLPRLRVIVGGPHPSGAPQDTALCPHFDVVVAGPAEQVMPQALTGPDRVIRAPAIEDLDALPPPARDLLPPGSDIALRPSLGPPAADLEFGQGTGKCGQTPTKRHQGVRPHFPAAGHLVTARGCPFDCAFCATALTHGRTCRAHSIDRVMAEVEDLRRDGAEALWFADDVLNLSAERLDALCQALRRLDPPMPFTASIRADLAAREQLAALKAAGCARLFFGVESANDDLLRETCGKTCSVEHARRVARWCDELGIEKNPGYILGLPGETPDDACRTIDLMRELGGRPAVSFLRIYPGTRIERLARERGVMPAGASWWDGRALRRLVCRPAFGETPLYLEGLTWRDVGRLTRAWAGVAGEPIRRRGLRALLGTRGLSDLGHLLGMARGWAAERPDPPASRTP
jgi:anaerobic magnesium-protoporphyrin IX monomethyl ester cyclase